MRLAAKFILVSLLVALLPLVWVGLRVAKDVDESLHAANWRLQRGLAERTADAVTGEIYAVVNLLSMAQSQARADAALDAAMNSHPALMDAWLYGADGKAKAAVHRLRASAGLAAADWSAVRQQTTDRGFYIGPAVFPPSGPPVHLVAVPALRDGAPTGTLAARVNLQALSESLQGLDLGTGGRVFLLDVQNRVLAHSLDSLPPQFAAPASWGEKNWRQGVYDGHDGVSVLGVKAPVKETGWSVVFEQPAQVALAAVNQVRRRVWWSLSFAAIFAVLLAAVLSGFITRPLRLFRDAVRKMQNGQFDALIPFRSGDEIGEIAQVLREAQPVLEKRVRDSVLGKMSRLIGHDMRQPVQGLRNSLDTILNHISDADDTAKKHFRLCYDSLDWINDFIEDILTVGREKPLVRKPLSANDLVRTTKAAVKVPEGVALTTALEANLPLCPIDEKEAKKALMNILKNALEAVGPGGKVEISTAPAGQHVRVLVSDNGPGFPPEKKARLFQEFTTKESGTGLGLLVVKKVMDQHGGKVELESEEGKGTRISLLFPVRPD